MGVCDVSSCGAVAVERSQSDEARQRVAAPRRVTDKFTNAESAVFGLNLFATGRDALRGKRWPMHCAQCVPPGAARCDLAGWPCALAGWPGVVTQSVKGWQRGMRGRECR